VACGNNNVSRSYLSSEPSTTSKQSAQLFNERIRARQGPLHNETAKAEGTVAVKNAKGKVITPEQRYSGILKDGVSFDYFLDENGNKTLNTDLHIHVVHDETNGLVRMHITDRRNNVAAKHTDHIGLKSPSGNDVLAAELKLADILRTMKTGKK